MSPRKAQSRMSRTVPAPPPLGMVACCSSYAPSGAGTAQPSDVLSQLKGS